MSMQLKNVSNAAGAAAFAFFVAITFFSSNLSTVRARASDTNKVRICVLGLFHPRELRVTAVPGSTLTLRAGNQQILLETSAGTGEATINKVPGGATLRFAGRNTPSSGVLASGRSGEPVEFELGVPGKITRRYRGTLEIIPKSNELIPVVTMDMETAVASVVAAESLPDTPMEALKAQAIAARSYFVSGRGGHTDVDFCDTTHCQFLREPPASGSAVAQAARATQGFVLAYESNPFAAMYTRSCSGRTRTPAQVGLSSAEYPYFSVECEYCRKHPAQWTSRVATREAQSLRSSNESSRLALDRRLGWSMVQSNDFVLQNHGDETVLQGIGHGHGIGLCQAGARAMAKHGASFQQILRHYYPNTSIVSWSVFQRTIDAPVH